MFTVNRRSFLAAAGAALSVPVVSSCSGHRKSPADDVPRSDFDEDSTAEQVTEGLDLSGKVAVVTGCTSGIGFETMRVLAMRGAYVLGTSRSVARAQAAGKKVLGRTSALQLELSNPDSVIECAEILRSMDVPIDILVCNAAYRGGRNLREEVNGVEKHLAVNHLGHFILVNRLLDQLYRSWQGRVVIVASRAAYRSAPAEGILFDDLSLTDNYSDSVAYGQSKLANVLFSYELGMRLRGTRITSNSLHPGVINTEIDRNMSRLTQFGFGVLAAVTGKNIEQGAATSCYVATSPLLGSTSGKYFEDCNAVTVADSHLQNAWIARRLWETTETLVGDHLLIPKRPVEPAADESESDNVVETEEPTK